MIRRFKYTNPEISFPDLVWAELVSSVIYILKRTGKSSLECVSSYELWIINKPRLKDLCVISSTSYAHIPVQITKKSGKERF